MTAPRPAVLEAATAHQGAFSVHELEQRLTARGESPGIASIFRTVRLLCDLNMLRRIHRLDERRRYSLGKGHSHDVVCTNQRENPGSGACAEDVAPALCVQASRFWP